MLQPTWIFYHPHAIQGANMLLLANCLWEHFGRPRLILIVFWDLLRPHFE